MVPHKFTRRRRRIIRPVPRAPLMQVCTDTDMFGSWFSDRASWMVWFTFLKALFCLPMTREELHIYKKYSQRDKVPYDLVTEAWLIVGRRGGKSLILALVAVYLACFFDWLPFLQPGERGTIMIIAQDRKQTRVILRYIKAFLKNVPALSGHIITETAESVDLIDQITIEVHTASFRAVRGYTIIAALLDEIAWWRTDDSLNPDHEILEAVRPGMATIPGAILLAASSPYAKRGVLWNSFKDYFGKKESEGDNVLIWKAPTWAMHPGIKRTGRIISKAYQRDRSAASAEYGAEFRSDVESFFTDDAVAAITATGRFELPPISGMRYFGFTDPSGGSKDSYTLGIAHLEDKVPVLDVLRETKPPFSPKNTTKDYAKLLKEYGVRTVKGDRYAGEWPREQFRDNGVKYEVSKRTASDLYLDLLPIVNSGGCELLDVFGLKHQLLGLDRRTRKSGKDLVDHGPGGHDDLANVAAGAIVQAHDCIPSANINMKDAIVAQRLVGAGEELGMEGSMRDAMEIY